MENIKQFLPWIIGGAIVLYVISRMGKRSVLVPQTQITQTPQPDPYAENRFQGFLALVGLANTETQAQRDITAANIASDIRTKEIETEKELSLEQLGISRELSLRNLDVNLSLNNAYIDALRQQLNFEFLTRSQDRDAQSAAIDRYYSARTGTDIIGSISGALASIFGNRSGSGGVFRTPPISSGFGGGFGGFGF